MFRRVSKRKQRMTDLMLDNAVFQVIIQDQQTEIDELQREVVTLLDAVRTTVEATASFEIGAIFERERILDYLMTKKIVYFNEEGKLTATSKNLYETDLVDLEV